MTACVRDDDYVIGHYERVKGALADLKVEECTPAYSSFSVLNNSWRLGNGSIDLDSYLKAFIVYESHERFKESSMLFSQCMEISEIGKTLMPVRLAGLESFFSRSVKAAAGIFAAKAPLMHDRFAIFRSWLGERAVERLSSFAELEAGWCGPNSYPLKQRSIDQAAWFLESVGNRLESSTISVFMSFDGEVILSWPVGGCEELLEIRFGEERIELSLPEDEAEVYLDYGTPNFPEVFSRHV
tara:strand:- start:197 stop:919 length:723 start_codon:yes stop_codon:yes gene_type:complete